VGLSKKVHIYILYILDVTYNGLYQRKVDSDDSSVEDSSESDSSTEEEELMTELDHYIKSPRIKDVDDPHQWWIDNHRSYPRLSRMAKDFLTIPGAFIIIIIHRVSYLKYVF
jgi:hAT family C-terminal dimerisation region